LKKALVLALTAFMVLSLATAAFAVEVTYEGEVAVTWGGEKEGEADASHGFNDDTLTAYVTVDFLEDYGDGLTAGVTTKVGIGDGTDGDFDGTLNTDSSGWIKLERDLFTVQASTGIDGGIGRDFGEFGITKKAGLGLDLNVIDGLTVNTIFNGEKDAYNFLVKGEFAQDLFTLGGGFESFYTDTAVKRSALGAYGTLNLIDGLEINGEFGSRNYDTEDDDTEAATAILASAAYDLDALSAKASFLLMSQRFGAIISADDVDEEEWRINEFYRTADAVADAGKASVTVVYADASYQITDDFEVNGWFDYLLGAKDVDGEAIEFEDDDNRLSYKVGAAYTLGDLTLSAYYKAWKDSKVGGKAAYALAEGVDASFEVGYEMPEDKEADSKMSYTAKIVAAF
jgi:hypothetical protein